MFSNSEKSFTVEAYLKSGSFSVAQKSFKNKYKTKRYPPSKSRIFNWTQKFRATGSVQKARSPGRPRHGRSERNIAAIAESVIQAPERSTCRRVLFSGLQMSYTTAWRISRKDLGLYPYTISMRHKLTARDRLRRRAMCEVFLQRIRRDPLWLNNVWFSDESHVYLSGKVNKTHCVFWGSQKPDQVLQKPLHSKKVTVWAAMSSQGIIGPFFFEDNEGNYQSVTSERYIPILNKFKMCLRRRRQNITDRWLMQDGAPPHR